MCQRWVVAPARFYLNALIEIGLVLFIMTLLINLLARLLIWRVTRSARAEVRA